MSPKNHSRQLFRNFSFSNTTNYLVQIAALLTGTGISLYLLVQHTELKSGIQASASFCSVSSFADCDVVNASDYSEVLGVPVAGVGAIFYAFLLMLALLFPVGQKGFAWGQGWIGRLSLLGLAVDAYLLLIQFAMIRNACVMCLLTYVVTSLVFFTTFWSYEKKKLGIQAFLRSILGPKFAPTPEVHLSNAFLGLLAFGAFAWVLWLIPASIRIRSQTYERVNQAMEMYFEQWKEIPVKKLPIKKGDGTFGNPDAKVQVVEFSDFECPHCQRAAFTLHTAMKALEDRVHFVFKHFPLDSSCNPSVKVQMHPNACHLARLAYCMEQKGKFWAFHDVVFFEWGKETHDSKNALNDAVVSGPLSKVVTPSEYQECLKNSASLANLQDDIRLGVARNVDGTPAVFINGKRITIPLSLENLKRLVEIESRL